MFNSSISFNITKINYLFEVSYKKNDIVPLIAKKNYSVLEVR